MLCSCSWTAFCFRPPTYFTAILLIVPGCRGQHQNPLHCGGVVWPVCGNLTTRRFRLYRIPIFISSYIIVCTVNTHRRRQRIIIPCLTLICASQCGLAPNYSVFNVADIELENHTERTSVFNSSQHLISTHKRTHDHFHGLLIPSSFSGLSAYQQVDLPGIFLFILL
jgi:hypothetical protein